MYNSFSTNYAGVGYIKKDKSKIFSYYLCTFFFPLFLKADVSWIFNWKKVFIFNYFVWLCGLMCKEKIFKILEENSN